MSRALALNVLPFGLVALLALAIGVMGMCVTPRASGVTGVSPSSTPTAAPRSPSDAGEMLRVHNELRAAVAAPAVRADVRVTAAAQRHAEYLAQNNSLGHQELPGSPGFSGATVRDRLAAQGYADATASEVATSFGSGPDGVRALWVLPYHRLGLMHPHAVIAGWGHADMDGRSTTVGVLVYDFDASAPDVVRSPSAGHRVPASWDGEESPDVLPGGATRPVGYPLMLIVSHARVVELRSARITDAAGRVIAYHVVPQLYERDYVAVVPAQPLSRGASFTVRLELRIAGVDAAEEWGFETEP